MRKTEKIFLAVIIFVFVLSYFRVPFLFFQQDELLGIGYFIQMGKKAILDGIGASNVRHFVPMSLSISFLIFKLFGLKYWAYNVIALLIHGLNGFLVYFLSKSIFKNKLIPFTSVLFFFCLSVASELVMWPVVNINMISLTFSLALWILIVNEKIFPALKGTGRGIIIAALFLLSVLSIEYSLGLLIFIPALVLLVKKAKFKEKVLYLLPFSVLSLLYLCLRVIPIILNKNVLGGSATGSINFGLMLSKIPMLVIRYIGQIFLGQGLLLKVSNVIGNFFGQMDKKEVYIENSIFPAVVLFAGITILLLCFLFYKKIQKVNKEKSTHFLVAILFLFSSSIPFLLVPGKAGASSIVSSRYLYFGVVGVSLVLSFLIDWLIKNKKKRIVAYTLIALIGLFGTASNFIKADQKYKDGMMRKEIVENIKNKYPQLPQKVVFYTESDSPYFGLSDEDKIMPFQSGFGQAMLIFYNESEGFSKEFFPGIYLWEIKSEGYEEHEARGFGYARNKETLKEIVKENNLEPESVLAFSWKNDTNSLVDITDEVRQEIKDNK